MKRGTRDTSPRLQRPAMLRHYYQLEKHLADREAFDLLWRCSEAFTDTSSTFYRHTAGWTLAESALIADTESTDNRHALIDMAKEEWRLARDQQTARDTNEASEAYRHFLRSPERIRIESSLATADVFHSMIDGDVTAETRQRYYGTLLELAVRASEGVVQYTDSDGWQSNEGTGYLGIAHELNAMLVVNRLQSPTLMAFPALPRADSGVNYPKQTHDITLFDMKWGAIQRSLPVEVKTTPNQAHFDRYNAVIVGGTMHLHPDNQRDPSYLAELLVKEFKGLNTPTEQLTLDDITDNVFHAARHGFGGIAQCHDKDTCQSVPLSRHGHIQHV